MIEIRIHGRGGQGVVTAARLLATAAFEDGKWVQSFPMFGVERRGAPVEGYVRIDDKPIRIRCHVYSPDYILVLDQSLIDVINIASGIKKGGMIIINSKVSYKKRFKCKTVSVDLFSIAEEILGRPIVNTAMLGAFAGITKLVTLNSLLKAIEKGMDKKYVEMNKKLVERAYEMVVK
jgi:pyruvate ferredoxin oxidoreductase gamma subunit